MSADTSGKKVCTKKSTKTCSGDEGTDELLEMRSKHEWLSNKEERITRTGKEKENTSLTRGSGKSRLRLHEARRVNALMLLWTTCVQRNSLPLSSHLHRTSQQPPIHSLPSRVSRLRRRGEADGAGAAAEDPFKRKLLRSRRASLDP